MGVASETSVSRIKISEIWLGVRFSF